MKHFSAASRMRSRWRAARVAAGSLAAATAPVRRLLIRGTPAAVLLPTAAERLVQGHAIVLLRQARRDQPLLRAVEAALRIEYGQVAVAAGLIALLGQVIGATRRIDQRLLRHTLAF